MVGVVKQELRKVVLKQISAAVSRVGEDKALKATGDLLRAQGSISRAALMDVFSIMYQWGQQHKIRDETTFNRIAEIMRPLDDIDRAKMIFGTDAGEGGAWAYLDAIYLAANKCNNRHTRQIKEVVTKARVKDGRPD